MKKSFAKGNNFYKMFWVFVFGCFLGVVIEVIWAFVMYGKMESRQGLVYGPFNLVYGFGALIFTMVLVKLNLKSGLGIIIVGSIMGGIFEYACSVIQEFVTGSVSWDYSDFYFNLNGRINLIYCIFWGLLAFGWYKFLFPGFSDLIEKIPNKIGVIGTWIVLVFFVFNTIVSALAVYRTCLRQNNIPPANAFEEFLDRRFTDERMHEIYPNMSFVEK